MQPDARHMATALARGYLALVALTFVLIVLGALVRAHQAGLACPDWPLCFGEFVPEMDLHVGFEWTHRLVAGSVALVFAGLSIGALRHRELRSAVGPTLAAAGALLVIQILLGALTVWQLLAAWTVTSHLLTGNAFALTTLWVAAGLREVATGAPVRVPLPRAARFAVASVAVLLIVQMLLGGLVSSQFAGLSCPEWPTCNGGAWFPTWRGLVGLHLLHRMNGYALLAALFIAWRVCRKNPRLSGPCAWTLAIGTAQVLVGILNVRLALPVEITGLHSALAAALVLATALAVRESWIAPRTPASAGESPA